MKLTLRELFLLVALAAMGCGWWVDHVTAGKVRVELEARNRVLVERSHWRSAFPIIDGMEALLEESGYTVEWAPPGVRLTRNGTTTILDNS